jgi:hypothetical protein
LTFHQQEEDQLRGDLLGGAGEEGLRKGWEVLGGRGGYGSGVGGEALVQCCDQSLIRPNSFGGAATLSHCCSMHHSIRLSLQLASTAGALSFAAALCTLPGRADPNAAVTADGYRYQINYQNTSWNSITFNKAIQPWWGDETKARYFARQLSIPGTLPNANPLFGGALGPSLGYSEPNSSSIRVAYGFRDGSDPGTSDNDVSLVRSYAYVVSAECLTGCTPALPSSSSQPYANIQSIGLDALKNQRELVLNSAGDCDRRGWVVYDSEKVKGKKPNKNKSLCVFAEGGYAQGSINGSTSVGGYDATNASSAYGVEWKPSKKWAVGAAYGYGSANLGSFNFQNTSAFINSNVNSGNIYGVYRPSKNWKIAALAGYSNFNFIGSRTYLGDTANSSFTSNGYTAALEASYDIILSKDFNNKKNPLAPVRVKPLVGLAWGGNQQNGFSETGSGTLFNVQGNTTNSLMATFGAKLEAPIPLNKKKTAALIPKFGIAYQYDGLAVLDANKSITASQQTSSTTSFTEVGQNRGPNGIYLDLGGDLQITPSLVVYANVNYQAFTYGNQIGYQGGLRMKL